MQCLLFLSGMIFFDYIAPMQPFIKKKTEVELASLMIGPCKWCYCGFGIGWFGHSLLELRRRRKEKAIQDEQARKLIEQRISDCFPKESCK